MRFLTQIYTKFIFDFITRPSSLVYPISILLTSSDEEDNSDAESEANSYDSDFESDMEDLRNVEKAEEGDESALSELKEKYVESFRDRTDKEALEHVKAVNRHLLVNDLQEAYDDCDSKIAELTKGIGNLGLGPSKQEEEQESQPTNSEERSNPMAVQNMLNPQGNIEPMSTEEIGESSSKLQGEYNKGVKRNRTDNDLPEQNKKIKEDTSDIVNDGSEPTSIFDLDGGD